MYILINNSAIGRVYISKFQVEKLVYKTIKNEYPKMNCYKVSYDQSMLTLYLHPDASFDRSWVDQIQKDAKKIFSDSYGIYIERVDIILN